jgi:hypothetical protein
VISGPNLQQVDAFRLTSRPVGLASVLSPHADSVTLSTSRHYHTYQFPKYFTKRAVTRYGSYTGQTATVITVVGPRVVLGDDVTSAATCMSS